MPVKSSSPSIQFHFQSASRRPGQRQQLKAFLRSLFKKEQTTLRSLTYIFCSDDYLLDINRQFLQHDYYTDIISFNLGPKSGPVEGEIYISIDRVADNAKELKLPINQELHRIIFHGALHLCGYKDKSARDKAIMRQKEDHYLTRYKAFG